MKKLFVFLVILLLCASVVISCGAPATQPAVTAPTTTPPAKPVTPSAPATTSPAATTPAATKPAPSPAVVNKYGGFIRRIEASSGGTNVGNIFQSAGSPKTLAIETPVKELWDGTIAPFLASSWDIVTDPAKLSVTLHFRKGVKFSDDTVLNAKAVKWNFDKMTAVKMYPSVTDYWKSVEILDDYTIRVNMSEYLNKSMGSFSRTVCYLISPTAWEKNGEDWIRGHQVGTGPFLQTDFQGDVSLTAVRNPSYWDTGKPYLDKFQYVFVADELTRLALFKTGGAEIMNCGGNARIAQELQNAGYKIVKQFNTVYMLVPDSINADSPWSNLKVRQAADYAIDKEGIVKAFGYGFWEANHQVNPSDSVAFDKSIPGRRYDVAKAKQLLAEAGYPNGFKTTLMCQNTDRQDIVVALQSYLGAAGIKCDIDVMTAAKYTTYRYGTWKNGIMFTAYGVNPNPTQGLNAEFGDRGRPWQQVMARTPGFQKVLDAAMITPVLEPALVQKAERMVYDNASAIPLYSVTAMFALDPKVQDHGILKYGSSADFDPMDIWLMK